MNNDWLDLADYSNKYHLSLSTLRRRIKEDSIQYRLDGGKYFILDEPTEKKQRGRKPLENSAYSEPAGATSAGASYFDMFDDFKSVGESFESLIEKKNPVTAVEEAAQAAPLPPKDAIFTAANRLLEELKRAYAMILQEKEEQILQLKEEVSDLRTLAQVLESENDRLRAKVQV